MAFQVLQRAIEQRIFPAASIAITRHGKLVALKAFGKFTYEPDTPAVSTATVFDLASVSKAVATTTMAMILYQRGLIDLDAPVISIVPEFGGSDARRGDVTMRMLLAHSRDCRRRKGSFLRRRTKTSCWPRPSAQHLPLIPTRELNTVISASLFWRSRWNALPMKAWTGSANAKYLVRWEWCELRKSATSWKPAIPPTADDRTFRKRIIQGEVQDENASVLGGVAGHAGLFSTAEDLATFAHVLLQGGSPLVRPETLALFTRRETAPVGTSRALGWDTPSSPSQSGKYFSARSFGHLGYTGTSLWIDPERQLSITMLTNRTWPDCSNKAIANVRPAFHNAVVEALGKDL